MKIMSDPPSCSSLLGALKPVLTLSRLLLQAKPSNLPFSLLLTMAHHLPSMVLTLCYYSFTEKAELHSERVMELGLETRSPGHPSSMRLTHREGIELIGEGEALCLADIAGPRRCLVAHTPWTLSHVHRKCPYCTVLTEDLRVTGSQGVGPRNFIFRQS